MYIHVDELESYPLGIKKSNRVQFGLWKFYLSPSPSVCFFWALLYHIWALKKKKKHFRLAQGSINQQDANSVRRQIPTKMHASNKDPIIGAKKKSSLVTLHIWPAHTIPLASSLHDPRTCSLLYLHTPLFIWSHGDDSHVYVFIPDHFLILQPNVSNDLFDIATRMSNKY